MTDQPLTPKEEHAAELSVRKEIARHKNRAIVPALEALADEVEERKASGQLKAELKGLKVSSLLGNLTRIIVAIKEVAPPVNINLPPAPQDPVTLRAQSAVNLSNAERERRRKAAIEGEAFHE